MNIKLHNKYEVITNGKVYVAYNTMLYTVFEKLKNLLPYNSYFAFGTGSSGVNATDTTLSSYVASFQTVTEEVQANCLKGDMFVTKSVVLDENEGSGLSFCEIGLTDTADSNPTIYNHVVLMDDENNIITVTKQDGAEMVIRLKIFIEVDNSTSAKLIAGDNVLVKQLLGENALTSTTLSVVAASNNQPNVSIYRNTPRISISSEYDILKYNLTNDGGVGIKFDCDFGANEVREVVVLADNKPVIRYNCLSCRNSITKTCTKTKNTNNCAIVDDDVKSVTSVTDATGLTNVEFLTDKFAHGFGDYIAAPFDMPFTSATTRFVSKDGSLIAFILNNHIYVYKNSNYLINKLDATAIATNNLVKLVMVDDLVFKVSSEEPYISCFRNIDNVLEPVTITTTALNDASFNFNLTDIDVTITKAEQVRIAGINQATNGVCVILSFNGLDELVAESMLVSTYTNIQKVVCLYKNNFCDSLVFFMTTARNGVADLPSTQMINASGEFDTSVSNAIATNILEDATEVFGIDRLICARRAVQTDVPIYSTYYFPESLRYNIINAGELDITISKDFKYIIKKFADGYKIYHIIGYNTPVEFDDGFLATLTQSEFVNFEFLKDSLLIFTSNTTMPIIAINLNDNSALLEGLTSTDPSELFITYEKYDILGSRTDEVVEAKITLTIGGFGE